MLWASIFGLQAHQTFLHETRNWKTVSPLLKVYHSLSSVSCIMSGRLFHEAEILKDYLTLFRQVQQSFFCGSSMSSSYSILFSSSGKRSFLHKWLENSIDSLFNSHHSLEIIGAARSRHVSLPKKVCSWNLSNVIFCRFLKCWRLFI